MWAVHVLKCPEDKDNAPSLSSAESEKRDLESSRSYCTLAHHLRLVTSNFSPREGPSDMLLDDAESGQRRRNSRHH